jgi:hypothetical protein
MRHLLDTPCRIRELKQMKRAGGGEEEKEGETERKMKGNLNKSG